jgi:hypothetical protein
MAKQTINIGTIADDGTGSTIRAGGDITNDNFNELYTKLGDGTTLYSLTFPNTTDTLVARDTSDTLTNKTLTSPVISTIINTGTLTLPTTTGTVALRPTTTNATGDGSTVAFTLTNINNDVDSIMVFLNGVLQRPTTDYTVSGTTLTFGTAPANADAITIKEF